MDTSLSVVLTKHWSPIKLQFSTPLIGVPTWTPHQETSTPFEMFNTLLKLFCLPAWIYQLRRFMAVIDEKDNEALHKRQRHTQRALMDAIPRHVVSLIGTSSPVPNTFQFVVPCEAHIIKYQSQTYFHIADVSCQCLSTRQPIQIMVIKRYGDNLKKHDFNLIQWRNWQTLFCKDYSK